MYTTLLNKITNKDITVGIIGLGYVGLPLLCAIANHGLKVLGFDISPVRVNKLNNGENYLQSVNPNYVKDAHAKLGKLATVDFAELKNMDVILICVPTPLSINREPDLSYVIKATEAIAQTLQRNQLIILESTTYPGTVDELMGPILEKVSGLKANEDFYLAYSPEREDPGNIDFSTSSIPKVVGADTEEARDLSVKFYEHFISEVVPAPSTRTAEAVKLTENIFRSVNIALVNELKVVFSKMDIDVWDVINAAKTKPFGFMPFYPGPGIGGHCIPIDPFYLTWKAHEYQTSTRFIELAGEINQSMPDYVVDITLKSLDKRFCKGLNKAKILIVGVAYKKDIDDYRESPAMPIINKFIQSGAFVDYYDPFVKQFDDHSGLSMTSIEYIAEHLHVYDAVVICTHHSNINWEILVQNARLVIDTRNATDGVAPELRSKVVKA